MIISIDTSSDKYFFALFWPNKISKTISCERQDKKDALFFLAEFLKKNKIQLKDLKALAVFTGPGSYTGLRVGISIANALGYVLNIPVIGLGGTAYQKNVLKIAKEGFKKINRKKKLQYQPAKPIY